MDREVSTARVFPQLQQFLLQVQNPPAGSDADAQFMRIERLGQVIVRARAQSFDMQFERQKLALHLRKLQ